MPDSRDGSARSASVKDVAQRAGVSLGTVSNVLNRPERVSADTRTRVENAMAELGFVRNESARQLRAGRSRTIGYVMLDATNPFFTDVAQGMEHVAEDRDLSLFLCNSDNRASREAAHLAHLQEQRVQGILVTPVDPDSPALTDLARRGTPLVIVDRTRPGAAFCTVSVDDVLGGPAGGRPPRRPRDTGGSPSSAAPTRSVRCASVSRAPARRGARPGCPTPTWSSYPPPR